MPLATLLALAIVAPSPDSLPHAALLERLRAAAAARPDRARVLTLGRSRGGREIAALRLADGEPPKSRPAILVVGNVDGPDVFSSGVALAVAERFAGEGEDVAAFLRETTLYVVPRANPDAAEARFATPRAEVEATGASVDSDRDRRDGEDPPMDVNGDGLVTTMRWPDPAGEWIADPADPRAMAKANAAKGERGAYKLSIEGRDLDRDGRVAEDAPRDAIVNRNFPHDWKEHGEGSGRFALDEPEGKALADFVLARSDIQLVVTYGALDNLVEKPKTVKADAPPQKRLPQPGVIEPDADLLAEIGRRYAEIAGNKTKGRGAEAGSFPAWIYHHRGLVSLAIALWDIPLDAEAPKEAPDDVKRLKWIDANSPAEFARFVPWTESAHPELGSVEIGGFAPFARLEPPDSARAEIATKQSDFVLSLGALLARPRVLTATAKELGGGLFEVKAAIENAALLPIATASGRRTGEIRPALVKLVLDAGAALAAGPPQELVRELAGSGGRREFRWLVRGGRPAEWKVTLSTDNAGTSEARVEMETRR